MSDGISEKLVNEVVQRVMAELSRQSPPASAATAQAPDPAASRADGDARATPAAAPESNTRAWLTVEMLADRAGGGPAVTLGPNELLTPAARDYAAARGVEVLRGGNPAQGKVPAATIQTPGSVNPAALTRTLGLVVNRPDAKAEAALAAASRGGVYTRGFAESSCWMTNARAMCGAINAGQLAGGAIIDRYAAAPMILTAKIKGIRPVQGVSVAAVEAALRQFNANVLVVGHAAASVYEIRSMIDRFAAGRRMGRDRTLLLDAVEELEGNPEP